MARKDENTTNGTEGAPAVDAKTHAFDVTFKVGKDKDAPEHKFTYKMPDDLDEAVKLWGAGVVWANAKAQIVIALQAKGRSMLTRMKDEKPDPASPADIQKAFDEYIPGDRAPAKTKTEKAKDLWAAMSPEERSAAMAELGLKEVKQKAA